MNREILSTWMKNWNPNFDSVEEVCLQGPGGIAYIVFSDESGPSDQTDINRTVFLDPLGRWNMISEKDSVWAL